LPCRIQHIGKSWFSQLIHGQRSSMTQPDRARNGSAS
jgi:hypothetical protein